VRDGKADPGGTVPAVLRVAQFNVLASSLGTPDSFPHADPAVLPFEARAPLIAAELARVAPDIAALEEVEEGMIPSIFAACGGAVAAPGHSTCGVAGADGGPTRYHFVHAPKSDDPTRDGPLVAVRADRFRIVRSEIVATLGGVGARAPQRAVLVELAPAGSDDAGSSSPPQGIRSSNILFAALHLKAGVAPEMEAVRTTQCRNLCAALDAFAAAATAMGAPWIVAGDFNGEPAGDAHAVMRKAGFTSVFDSVSGGMASTTQPAYTTVKVRDREYKRVIDYILLRDGNCGAVRSTVCTKAVFGIPERSVHPAAGLPSAQYGSDHLLLAAEVQVVLQSQN
jgi:endonuclease/exonuclease/phosphatase family metal-dependent hydrolase